MRRTELARIALIIGAMAAPVAHAGVGIDVVQPSPASRDVVITWATDAAAVPPLSLLRRVLSPAESLPDAIPLDPVADLALAGLTGSSLTLPGEMDALASRGVIVYQVIDSTGSCSNAGYVVRTERAARDGFCTRHWTFALRLPARHGYADARSLLDALPQVQSVIDVHPRPCVPSTWLERDGAGGYRGTNFTLAGKPGVVVSVPSGRGITYAGASSSRDVDALVQLADADPACHSAGWLHFLRLSPASRNVLSVEFLCGTRLVDWPDADGDRIPDDGQCVAGIWPGTGISGIYSLAPFPGCESGWTCQSVERWPFGLKLVPRIPFQAQPDEAMLAAPSTRDSYILRASDAGARPCGGCFDSDGDTYDDCLEQLDGTDPLDAASHGPDWDRDGVRDDVDRCPSIADAAQPDQDGDGAGDACDPCPSQADDACMDPDGDGVPDGIDNCPDTPNPDQQASDDDSLGDACDNCDHVDNCQEDADADGMGDACDPCRNGDTPDTDGDGVMDCLDNCPSLASSDQGDMDVDGIGTPCDNCPGLFNLEQMDSDRDGLGNSCDCDDGDPLAPSRPDAIRDLRVRRGLPGYTALFWTRPAAWPAARPLEYEVVGGSLDDLRADRGFARAACEGSVADPLFGSRAVAPRWWLVRARAGCGVGSLGEDADVPGRITWVPADMVLLGMCL